MLLVLSLVGAFIACAGAVRASKRGSSLLAYPFSTSGIGY